MLNDVLKVRYYSMPCKFIQLVFYKLGCMLYAYSPLKNTRDHFSLYRKGWWSLRFSYYTITCAVKVNKFGYMFYNTIEMFACCVIMLKFAQNNIRYESNKV